MSEATLGSDHLLPYESGAASPASAEGDFEDLAGAILGEAPTDPEAPAPEAEAEGEPDEVEADQSDESDDDVAEESDEDEPEAPPTYRVRVDGQEIEVALPELIAGYSRHADYTRKTTEVATQRKALEADAVAYRNARDQYAQRLPAIEAVLAETMPPEPDAALRQSNPGEYAVQLEERRAHTEKLAAIRAEKDSLRAEQEREFHEQRNATLKAEHDRLVAAVPEWKDQAKRETDMGKLVQYAASHGIDEAYLDSVTDHRFVLFLRDSMLYREAQTKGKDAIREKVATAPVLKPGGRPQQAANKAKRSEIQRQAERLEKTGRVDDAAKLFEHLF